MAEKEVPAIARQVKKLREAAGFSQQDLAVKAGLSISVVSQIEQGRIPDPRTSTTTALAKALGVDCETLTGNPGTKPRKAK
jgi:transcriptional regulator with XRE-family HTH domain